METEKKSAIMTEKNQIWLNTSRHPNIEIEW